MARRVCFISATYLVREWKRIPDDVMENALFFFGSKRSWLFPKDELERRESRRQPTDYLNFDPGFLELVLEKERSGLLFFLKPEKEYSLVSTWLEGIVDPSTGANYQPLKLENKWWTTEYDRSTMKYRTRPEFVIQNFQLGEHDYNSTMELLYQSNPTLIPMKEYKEALLRQ